MSPFVRSAKTAIEEIIKSVSIKDRKYLSVGYTIYRDYPDGKFAVVSTEPSSDFDQFSKEVEGIKCFSQAPTRAEAFYQGLIEGIKAANFNDKFAQNLLVVIGDAGNHIDDSLTIEDVEAALEGKKITLFGLQTTNGAHASYLDFNQDILKLAAASSSSGNWVEESESKFTFKSSNSEEIAAWETESSIYIGNAKGEPTDPIQMSNDIVFAIQKVESKKDSVAPAYPKRYGRSAATYGESCYRRNGGDSDFIHRLHQHAARFEQSRGIYPLCVSARGGIHQTSKRIQSILLIELHSE